MAEKAIIYITDNSLDEGIAFKCRQRLLKASMGIPIVCVTQLPLAFGSITIGVDRMPRSIASITRQILTGLQYTDARWVFIAEHDCVYSAEHFMFTPHDDTSFWYNTNVWLVQHHNENHPEFNGMYSFKKNMFHQSQMVSGAAAMWEAQNERLSILEDDRWMEKYPDGRVGEPGAASLEKAMKLSRDPSFLHIRGMLKHYCTHWKSRTFCTQIPNLDIRHGSNFSGQLRGKSRTFDLRPWGTWDSVFS